MSLQNKYFDPNIYARKVLILIILFIIDIIANCFTQYMDFGTTTTSLSLNLLNYPKSDEDAAFAIFA